MKKTVPGEGPLQCKICFIGEAPGEHEERFQRPFVGPAGRLFDELLRKAGIVRGMCRVTNVVKERPPSNDISVFLDLSKKEPRMTASYKEYVEDLKKELEQCTANILVPLGNVPLFALTGRKGITKWRGSILESTLLPGRKVVPTIHPSAALREYMFEYYIMHDLQRVLEESETPNIVLPSRRLLIRPSFSDVMEFLRYINTLHSVAFDIEVMNDQVSCISFAPTPTECMSIPFITHGEDYFSPEQEAQVWRAIGKVLENPSIMKIGQNVIFDCTFLFMRHGIRTRPAHCTMIAQGLLYPDLPKGLDFITSTYTKEPYYKEEGKKYFRLNNMADGFIANGQGELSLEERFWIYNAKDSAVCMEAYPKQILDLGKMGNLDTYIRQVSLIEPLMYMQARGIKVDMPRLERMKQIADRKVTTITRQLQELVGYDINPNSPKQLAALFYVQKGLTPYINRKTGGVSTDDDALKRLVRKGVKEAALVRDIRKWSKLKGTYLEVTLDEDKRMRGAMNPIGAADTGRLSSGKTIFDTGGNMQNQPPQMKRMLVADDGCLLYVPDLSQAENRLVAYMGPVPAMRQSFEEGRDLHLQTAAFIFHKDMSEVTTKPGTCSLGGGDRSERDWGKICNHSLNYGFGYRAFSLRFELEEKEGKRLWEGYHKLYPEVQQQYHRWVKNQLSESRCLTNPYGRTRYFMGRWGEDLFQEAYAFLPQSTVADKMNKEGILFIHNNQDIFSPVELLNQEHDSLWIQIPLSIPLEQHAHIMQRLIASLETPITYRGSTFTIPVEVKVGFNIGDMAKVDLRGERDEAAKRLSISIEQARKKEKESRAKEENMEE
jgi:uracil-DNA glycosylase family 4